MHGHPPLYVQIQQFIRQGIEAGDFQEGDRLPSEPELARRFGTTRATVARAFHELAFDGTIDRRSGSGTFVARKRPEDRVDTGVIASHEDRQRAAGTPITYDLVDFAPAQATPRVAAWLEIDEGAPVYRLQRQRQDGGRVVAVEDRYLPEALGKGIRLEWLEVHTVQHVLEERLGLRIATIDNAVSAAVATVRQARLFGISRNCALLVREHVIFDSRARPVLAGETLYPGDFRVRYTLRAKNGR